MRALIFELRPANLEQDGLGDYCAASFIGGWIAILAGVVALAIRRTGATGVGPAAPIAPPSGVA